MCGIVGLHLRNPDLHPRLGQLLTGMLCEMADRGSDSAGVAVYGDPTWTPPGSGSVSLLEVDATTEEVASALGPDVTVTRLDETYLVTAQTSSASLAGRCQGGLPAGADRRLRRRRCGAQRRWAPKGADRCLGIGQRRGLAGRWSHPDGDGVCRDAVGLSSLCGRARSMSGAQRLVRQPRHHPSRITRRRSRIRQRERHRGRCPIRRPANSPTAWTWRQR